MNTPTEYLAIAIREGRTSPAARFAAAFCLCELSADPRLTEEEREMISAIWLDYKDLSTRDAGRRAAESAEALVRAELEKSR